jgi:hypothetical protein
MQKSEIRPKFWYENLKKRDNLGGMDGDGRIVLKNSKEIGSVDWTALVKGWVL